MAGLLEAALAACLCKVGLSILWLRMVRGGSLSSVGLCCGCLLLLTDLAITLFLAFLRLAHPWLVAFPVSADIIALRFLLFLTHTYWGVMLLSTPLVAMEMAFHLRWPHLRGMEGEGDGGKDLQTRGEEWRTPLYSERGEMDNGKAVSQAAPERAERSEGDSSSAAVLAHIACVLSCLLAWCISGLRAERRWNLDIHAVKLCLMGDTGGGGGGGISSLWRCLPSLLSVAWPDVSEPFWGLLAAVVLLGLYWTLSLLSLRPDAECVCPERAEGSPVDEKDERKHSNTDVLEQAQTARMGPMSAELSLEWKREREPTTNADVRVQMQTRHVSRAPVNPSGGGWTNRLTVDTETTIDRCRVLSTERRQPPYPHGKCHLSSPGFVSVPDSCGSPTEAEKVVRQMQDKQLPTHGQHPLRQSRATAENMCFTCTAAQSDSGRTRTDPQQLQLQWCPRRCCQTRAFQGGSPSPRGLLIAALVWGIFICFFPMALGFSVLIIRHTETLVLFGLKVLGQTPPHDKHTESTRTECTGS
ncbi:hypothetical protein AALO_G00139740 [Alosa alosa]|uniref:Uncharacterized protein n=1 Tax=Alosa alosa TaxID=278164 RepID=A0AAV6GM98_9TELE|nr:uncharacterized protein LOC125301815 [Alosa alosa]KAG5274752.1 hypothetical protein AALO_G00139740 [Alosa alosa]